VRVEDVSSGCSCFLAARLRRTAVRKTILVSPTRISRSTSGCKAMEQSETCQLLHVEASLDCCNIIISDPERSS
jgi:hypothetical protein